MMECTTGLTDDEFDGLLAWLREEGVEGYPPILGLSGSLTATLMYLRCLARRPDQASPSGHRRNP